jgi:predicted ATPase
MQHRAFAWLYGQEPGLTAHSYLGWIFWLSGYPAQAAEHTRQSLKIGREVEHALSRCHSLFFAAVHAHLVHDWKELRVLTDELFLYSHERKAVFWIDAAEVLTGLLATKDGNGLAGIANMRRVVESLAAADIALCVPILYRFVAEAYAEVRDFDSALAAMDSAMQLSDRTLQFFYQPELYRCRGELLIRQGGQLAFPTAEDMFRKALDMAREQSAKSWELRAALSLSELLLEQGRRAEAVELLQPLCGWFTEARETGDLRKADTLLRGLR